MEHKRISEITFCEFRMIKTLSPFGEDNLLLIKFYYNYWDSENKFRLRKPLMWSAKLLQEIVNGEEVKIEDMFIRDKHALHTLLIDFWTKTQSEGITLYRYLSSTMERYEITYEEFISMVDGLFIKAMTIDNYRVLDENLVVIVNEEVRGICHHIAYTSGHPYYWLGSTPTKRREIIDLSFQACDLDTMETKYGKHLCKVKEVQVKYPYILMVKSGRDTHYVSGIKICKDTRMNKLFKNDSISMAIQFANEDEAIESIMSLGDLRDYDTFGAYQWKSSDDYAYINPPSVWIE